MNKAQKIVVVIALLAMVALGLVPPRTSVGGREPEGFQPLWTTSGTAASDDIRLGVDYGALFISWTVTVLAAGACVMLIGVFRKKDDRPVMTQGSAATTLLFLAFIGVFAVAVARGYQRIIKLEDKVAKLTSQTRDIDSLQESLAELERSIDQQSRAIHTLLGARVTMTGDLTAASTDIIRVFGGVSSLSREVSTLSNDVSQVSN